MLEYNLKTFGKVTIGVHGGELPKFSEHSNLTEYWKLVTIYNPQLKIQSSLNLLTSQRYWLKPDRIAFSNIDNQEPPVDPLKTYYVGKKVKNDVTKKVNESYLFNKEEQEHILQKGRAKLKWAAKKEFSNQNKTVNYDNITSSLNKDAKPLYSSFAPDNIFVDPLICYKSVKT